MVPFRFNGKAVAVYPDVTSLNQNNPNIDLPTTYQDYIQTGKLKVSRGTL